MNLSNNRINSPVGLHIQKTTLAPSLHLYSPINARRVATNRFSTSHKPSPSNNSYAVKTKSAAPGVTSNFLAHLQYPCGSPAAEWPGC